MSYAAKWDFHLMKWRSCGTAANMNYAAIATREDRGLEVTAVVTAGVQGNAVRG
jgi:hypothetical protein